jgi:hypothetical protein
VLTALMGAGRHLDHSDMRVLNPAAECRVPGALSADGNTALVGGMTTTLPSGRHGSSPVVAVRGRNRDQSWSARALYPRAKAGPSRCRPTAILPSWAVLLKGSRERRGSTSASSDGGQPLCLPLLEKLGITHSGDSRRRQIVLFVSFQIAVYKKILDSRAV